MNERERYGRQKILKVFNYKKTEDPIRVVLLQKERQWKHLPRVNNNTNFKGSTIIETAK